MGRWRGGRRGSEAAAGAWRAARKAEGLRGAGPALCAPRGAPAWPGEDAPAARPARRPRGRQRAPSGAGAGRGRPVPRGLFCVHNTSCPPWRSYGNHKNTTERPAGIDARFPVPRPAGRWAPRPSSLGFGFSPAPRAGEGSCQGDGASRRFIYLIVAARFCVLSRNGRAALGGTGSSPGSLEERSGSPARAAL